MPGPERWRSRPALSFALRAAVALLPAIAAASAAVALRALAPAPGGAARLGWILWILIVATLVALGTERAVRRALPLAVLLQLSLAFPDRAPSRFVMARSAGNVKRLEERIRLAEERGIDDDPARAARQILELVAALSAHDRKTRGHSERVRAFADMLAGEFDLSDGDRDRLRWAALLHDIGKLRVPGRILNKAGTPDPREWERLMQHPAEGERIAAPLSAWLGPWAATIVQHHERFDGTGYPAGLARDEISLGARIVSLADSFEVMTAARAYKKPMSVPAARRELARCAGSQFDPVIVRSFLNISIGRLWWTVGPTSWMAVTPVLGWLQRSGAQIAIAAKGVAVIAALGVGGAVQIASASAAAPAPAPAPTTADAVHVDLASSMDPVGDPTPASGDNVGADGESTTDGDSTTGGGGSTPSPDPVGDAVSDAPSVAADSVSATVDAVNGTVDGTTGALDQATGDTTAATSEAMNDAVQTVTGAADDEVQQTLGSLGL